MGIGVRGLALVVTLLTIINAEKSLAKEAVVPRALPVQVLYRQVGLPLETPEGLKESVQTNVFTAQLNTNAEKGSSRTGQLELKPSLVYDVGEGPVEKELHWMKASPFQDFVQRIPKDGETLLIEMEDGTWTRAIAMGLYVDFLTEKIYVPFKVYEMMDPHQGAGTFDFTFIEVPIEELGDRVLTSSSLLDVGAQKNYFINGPHGKVIEIEILGFEAGKDNEKPAGPLANFIPGFRNKSHSAIAVLKSELESTGARSVELYRIPVPLLRMATKAKRELLPRAEMGEAAQWLFSLHLRDIPLPEALSVEDRRLIVMADAHQLHPLASQFDLNPQSCRALIVREQRETGS